MSELTFDVSEATLGQFDSFPREVRMEIREALAAIKSLHEADDKAAACTAAALSLQHRSGYSEKSLQRKLALYKKGNKKHGIGDWRLLLNHTTYPEKLIRLPEDFVSYWQGLCQENQRKSKPAHRKLVRNWHAGQSIPGYGTWRDWFIAHHEHAQVPTECPPDLPRGWSYENLMRYEPAALEMKLARYGIAKAREDLPAIIRTRDGLRPMEYVVLDDWRSDFRVHAGVPTPCMLNGVLAMDVACAMPLRFGLRPALPRDDGSNAGIQRADTKATVAQMLLKFGYPLDYKCTLIVERGTATISIEDAAAIEELTNGQVRVTYTSMISGSVFGFADRPVGNSLGKAWLESYFNLVHNEAAALPGQMGAQYTLQPACLDDQVAHARALVKAGQFLPPALRNQVRIPFMSLDEALQSHEIIFRWHRNRTEHDLEAFADVLEYRTQDMEQWRPADELAGAPPAVLDRIQTRTRKESPLERWARLVQGVKFRKLSMACMPRLLEDHRWVVCDKPGEIALQVDNKRRVWRDRNNPALQQGARFLAYFDRNDMGFLHLTTGDQRYVASLPEAKAIRHGDVAALQAEIREKQAHLNRHIDAVRKRNPDGFKDHAEALDANIAIFEKAQALELVSSPVSHPVDPVSSPAPDFVRQIGAVDEARVAVAERHAFARARAAANPGHLDDLLGSPDSSEPSDDPSDPSNDPDLDALL